MSGNWLHNIKHVTPGEPVQAGVVSRPDRTLENRTDYLRDRLDAAALGQAIFDTDATVAPDVLAGHPVYWNSTEKRYERAQAAVETDATSQTLVVLPSSDCVGMCLRKKGETLADVVLHGVVDMPELQNAITGPIAPGRYYLSGTTCGKLVKQRPAVSVFVCQVLGPKDACSTVPRVVVMPHVRDFIDEHTHYRFDLVCRPAGPHEPPNTGDEHVITVNEESESDTSATTPGWLPVSHSVFNNKAPAGALFGYNLNAHPALSNVWPPLPIQSVAVLWDKGENHVGATEVPLGAQGLVVCDTNGIWWMSNCYGDVPWPATLDTTVAETPVTPGVEECPREETMRLSVVFLRMLLGNDRNVVTSIEPDIDESPIVVTNCAGAPATTGDLRLDLNMQYAAGEALGGQAVKQIVDGKKLKRGWVAEGAFTVSNQISIKGVQERALTTAEKEALELSTTNTIMLQQGVLQIDYTDQLVERELSPQIIRLSDTVERLYMDIPYIGFPYGQASLLRVRFNVPGQNIGDNLNMKVRVQYFGRGGSAQQAALLPSLYMSYRVLPAPALTNNTGIGLISADTPIAPLPAISLLMDKVIQRESAPFGVSQGDTVLFTIGRDENPADVYGEVGVLRITGIVYSTT
jgi:hypothetical protein